VLEASELAYPIYRGDVAVDEILGICDAVVAFKVPTDIVARAPNLRWIHFTGVGMEGSLNDSLTASEVTITNSGGVNSVPIAEMVLSMMLIFAKSWPTFLAQQQDRVWRRHVLDELHGKTLGVVGLGHIGGAVTRLGKAMGMRVLGVKRHIPAAVKGVDEIFPPRQLMHVLSASDFVVLCVPLTDETHNMCGESELRAMRPHSYLINVSRGAVVQRGALLRALSEHWIAGAGLDAFHKEPLPSDDPLWDLPNVLITPHLAGDTPEFLDRVVRIVAGNLRRYISGQPLTNVINKELGY
jgi:phosphoglycerate dehydrogenase-like enzyme